MEVQKTNMLHNYYFINNVPHPATEKQGWTPFQLATLDQIALLPDFDHFMGLAIGQKDYDANDWPVCPKAVTWFDKQNKLHVWRVGAKRILKKVD